MSDKKIVCFGEVMMRYVTLTKKKFIQSFPGTLEASFGGAECNVACSLAYLGGRHSCFVSALPTHEIADACLTQLRGLGIDTRHIIRTKSGRLGVYYLEAGANQRPSKVLYDREYSAISLSRSEDFDWEGIFDKSLAFHVTGITPALSRIAAETALFAIREAKSRNITTFCDLNFRKKLWNWENGTDAKMLARRIMREIIQSADILIANEEDAADVLDIHAQNTDIEGGKIDYHAYEQVAKEIITQYPHIKKVAITLRESLSASHNNWGALLYDASTEHSYLAPLKDKVYTPYTITDIVDRVGGGDSFAAGLIYALTDEALADNQSAISFAVALSCLAHSIEGDFNLTTKAEALSLMKGSASGRVQR